MNTLSVDTLRVDIFKELINLETPLLQEILDASADYAIKAHKRGEFHSTGEIMDKLGKEMGWM